MSVTPSDHSTENISPSITPDPPSAFSDAPLEDRDEPTAPFEALSPVAPVEGDVLVASDLAESPLPTGVQTQEQGEVTTEKIEVPSPADSLDEIAGVSTEAIPAVDVLVEQPTRPVETIPHVKIPPLRGKKVRRPRSRRRRIVILSLVALIVLGIAIPAGIAISYGISAYSTYNELKNQAHDGVQHLLNVKNIFTGVKTHPTSVLDTTKLYSSDQELGAALKDFQQLSYKIDHTALIHTFTSYFPQYAPEVQTARTASQIGMEVATMGQEVISTALILAPAFHGSLLGSSSTPLVTQDMLNLVGGTIDELLPQLTVVQQQASTLSLNSLPVSATQSAQFAQMLQLLPQAINGLTLAQSLMGAANWLLGVDSPRTFLVQTMDRAELRGTGGFTGQYGELTINGGRVGTFTLKDISLVEYTDTSKTLGQSAPSQYSSWWPFANWGLRDSNISADFPTAAKVAISQYQDEVGKQVDGVIMFTPFLIEHILNIIGPIHVAGYNETITAQNLEDRLHYYQQDNSGIAKQIALQPGNTSTSARKRFTSQLAHDLLDQVRSAPTSELLAIGEELLHDLKTKDLEVYVANTQVEGLLEQYGDAAQVNRSTTQDGLYVVQQNLSASKASQYVKTIMHDTVTLDPNGGATHVLQLRLVYNQIGPVYGYDTYRDYVRVYVPPGAKLLYGDGFDTGTPLCGGYYSQCPASGVYTGGELVCPTGLYQPGAHAPTIADSNGGTWGPLDTIGPPTNLQSDEPGRAMFGGWVVIPKNCTMTVTLSWYVPPIGHTAYSLLVQKQAGLYPELDLTILPTPGDCAAMKLSPFHFNGLMGQDMAFTPPALSPALLAGAAGCYPQPGV